MEFKKLIMASCAVAAFGGLSTQAFAQTAAEPGAAALEEVVVTANKRAENLQDVAAAVTAVGVDQLQRQGIKDITDISKVIPEVNVNTGALTNVTIRGIRTGATGPTTDSPNAVHIDGAYVARFTSLQGLFFDVERIEVLAGPQGTLYGRNAAGGTMNIISRKPVQDFGGDVSVEVGNYESLTFNGALNIPLTSNLAMRAAYWRNQREGFIDNGTDDVDQEAGRLSMRWTPTPQTSLLFTADFQHNRGRGGGSGYIVEVLKNPTIVTNANGSVTAVAAGTPGGVIVPIKIAPDRFSLSAIYGNQDLAKQNTDGGGVMGQLDHDFGWANMTFQASYRNTATRNVSGATLTGFPQDPRLISTTVLTPGGMTITTVDSKWNSQELRFTSPADQSLTWVAGLYRFYESGNGHQYTYRVRFPNTSAATVGVVERADIVDRDIPNDISTDLAYAAFGQATWTPSALPALHLTGGLRYNYEKKRGAGGSTANGVYQTRFDQTDSWTATTYKLNASYDITPQNMIYVDHSTGFKSGGFGFGISPKYDPENIKAYEIGTKNRFFDNRLQVNAAAWHYDYEDFVANIPELVLDQATGRYTQVPNSGNAGGAKINGQSIAVEYLLTSNDTITFNAVHTKGKYTEFDARARYAPIINSANPGNLLGARPEMFDWSGEVIGNVPDWSGNFTYSHLFRMASGTLDAQMLARYVGKRLLDNQATSLNPNTYTFGQPYVTLDFTLRYAPNDGDWTITGFVRNALNHDVVQSRGYVSNNQYLAPTDPRVLWAWRTRNYGPPRTFGVQATARF